MGELSPIISKKDTTIPELPVKDFIYRIYRDVRFSPDKTPYKTYFAVTWSRTGRKGPYAHYYMHIQPGGGSFFGVWIIICVSIFSHWLRPGGGYYGSDNLTLACLREDIDQQPHQFKSILMDDRLRKTFFPDMKADQKKVVAAFCKMSAENALKKKPKVPEHPPRIFEVKLTSLGLRCGPCGHRVAQAEKLHPPSEDYRCRNYGQGCPWPGCWDGWGYRAICKIFNSLLKPITDKCSDYLLE